MLNFLDLLVIVFMALSAVSLLSLCLMFLVRNHRVKKICFFIVAALGVYAASIGIRIGGSLFPLQTAIGAAAGLASIAAILLVLTRKGNEKRFRIARIIAAAALVIGLINAFV